MFLRLALTPLYVLFIPQSTGFCAGELFGRKRPERADANQSGQIPDPMWHLGGKRMSPPMESARRGKKNAMKRNCVEKETTRNRKKIQCDTSVEKGCQHRWKVLAAYLRKENTIERKCDRKKLRWGRNCDRKKMQQRENAIERNRRIQFSLFIVTPTVQSTTTNNSSFWHSLIFVEHLL